jgi:hypothetical protein
VRSWARSALTISTPYLLAFSFFTGHIILLIILQLFVSSSTTVRSYPTPSAFHLVSVRSTFSLVPDLTWKPKTIILTPECLAACIKILASPIPDLRLLRWEYKSNCCKVCQTFNIVQISGLFSRIVQRCWTDGSNTTSASICCFCSCLLFFRYVRSSCFSFNYPYQANFEKKGLTSKPYLSLLHEFCRWPRTAVQVPQRNPEEMASTRCPK